MSELEDIRKRFLDLLDAAAAGDKKAKRLAVQAARQLSDPARSPEVAAFRRAAPGVTARSAKRKTLLRDHSGPPPRFVAEPERAAEFLKLVRMGASDGDAARQVEWSTNSINTWLRRAADIAQAAEDGQVPTAVEEAYLSFADRHSRARAERRTAAIGRVRIAAEQGSGERVQRREQYTIDKKTGERRLSAVVVITTKEPPDWRAALALAALEDPDRFSQRVLDTRASRRDDEEAELARTAREAGHAVAHPRAQIYLPSDGSEGEDEAPVAAG